MFSVLFLFLIEFLHFFSLHILKTDGFMGERYAIPNVVLCWRDGDFARFGLRSDMSNVSVWIKCNINRRGRRRQRCRRFGSPYRSSLILSRSLLSYFVSILFLKMYEQLYELIAAVHVRLRELSFPSLTKKRNIVHPNGEKWVIWFLVKSISDLSLSSTFRFSPFDVYHRIYTRIQWTTVHTTTTKTATTLSYVPLQLCVCFCCVRISPGIQSLCAIVSFSPFFFSVTFGFSLSLVSHS